MAIVPADILDKWVRADRIRKEFYDEKAKVDILLEEAMLLCNSVVNLRTKQKSVVRNTMRPKIKHLVGK